MKRILVTGATGRVGGAALHHLRARGAGAVAAVRRPESAGPIGPRVAFDFRRRDTWDAALEGVGAILLVRPPAVADVGPTLNAFVDRAVERCGQLEQVVLLSVTRAADIRWLPHARAERHLRRTGLACTLLRAGFFAQNLVEAYRDDIRHDGRLYVPAGRGRVAWVDTRDLGEAAARALLDPGPGVRAWTLTGGEARSFDEVASLLTRALGRPVHYDEASIPGHLRHLRRRHGLPWTAALVQTLLHAGLRSGAEARVDPTLERVLGRPPRTVADTIRDHLEAWMHPTPPRAGDL